MNYTDEEYDALMSERLTDSDEEVFRGRPQDMQHISMSDLEFLDNETAFETIKDLIFNREALHLEYGIENGKPFYTITDGQKLYLNKGIIEYIYNWLKDGIDSSPEPTSFIGDKNTDETYMLRLLQRDNINKVTTYNPRDGYKAKYERGIILYGQADCAPEEMRTKLASL